MTKEEIYKQKLYKQFRLLIIEDDGSAVISR